MATEQERKAHPFYPTHVSEDGEMYRKIQNCYVDEDVWFNGGRVVSLREGQELGIRPLPRKDDSGQ